MFVHIYCTHRYELLCVFPSCSKSTTCLHLFVTEFFLLIKVTLCCVLFFTMTSLRTSVTDHQCSGKGWAGCFTPHPQSEGSIQLGWTPCLCQVMGGTLVHLTQFHVIWVWNGQRLGSGGTEGSVETSHVSRAMSFPCACKTRVSIMSLGLKKWRDYFSLKPFLMSLSMMESLRNIPPASEQQHFNSILCSHLYW